MNTKLKISSVRISILSLFLLLILCKAASAQYVPETLSFADLELEVSPEAQVLIKKDMTDLLSNAEIFNIRAQTAALFMPLIEDILKEQNLPEDFKYLALLDNNQPDSLLLWQMAKSFALELGLRINEEVDERQSVLAATRAVSRLLSENQKTLHNWVLTLLSYHLGTEGVQNYVKNKFRNEPPDQVAAQHRFNITEDTHPDILHFIAYKLVYQSTKASALDPETELVPYSEAEGQSIEEIARSFSLESEELQRFNPWLKASRIPSGEANNLILPIPAKSPSAEVQVVSRSRGGVEYSTLDKTFVHIVERGQTLYGISRLYEVPLNRLMQWNNLHEQSILSVGQQLRLIRPGYTPEEKPALGEENVVYHSVERGQTLYGISRQYDVSVNEIKRWNELFNDQLFIGQKLKIKTKKTNLPTPLPPPPPQEDQRDKSSNQKGPQPQPPTDPTPQPPSENRKLGVKVVPTQMQIAGLGLRINAEAQRLIQRDVELLTKSEKYFFQRLRRIDIYMPLVEKILREENIPLDFKYLPIQESAFIANAVSSSQAVGYWQFKAASAQEVGLQVDNKVDERMNIVSATRGAASYFRRNHLLLKNWLVTLLSFNMGYTGAKNYVARHYKPHELQQGYLEINAKTHWYIRKFLAHKVAYENEIGREIPAHQLEVYEEGARKTLAQVAKEFNSEEATLEPYNLWLKRNRIPDEKIYPVIVPLHHR